jgi:hypothetical protein
MTRRVQETVSESVLAERPTPMIATRAHPWRERYVPSGMMLSAMPAHPGRTGGEDQAVQAPERTDQRTGLARDAVGEQVQRYHSEIIWLIGDFGPRILTTRSGRTSFADPWRILSITLFCRLFAVLLFGVGWVE